MENRKKAVIFDLDGTLAILSRDPYDLKNVEKDKLNNDVAEILKLYHLIGFEIIIISGRSEICLEATKNWLKNNGLFYDELYLRPNKNNDSDDDFKRLIYHKYINGKFSVQFVIEDRDKVVRMWRELGLTCLQCNYGDF